LHTLDCIIVQKTDGWVNYWIDWFTSLPVQPPPHRCDKNHHILKPWYSSLDI
jgi:hypothetical protein